MERLLSLRAGVRIDEMPLAAALEPDAIGAGQHRRKGVAVRELPLDRVQEDDMLRAGGPEGARSGPVGGIYAVAAGCGHIDDERLRSAGELYESAEHFRTQGPTADDEHRAVLRPDGGRLSGRDRPWHNGQTNKCYELLHHPFILKRKEPRMRLRQLRASAPRVEVR